MKKILIFIAITAIFFIVIAFNSNIFSFTKDKLISPAVRVFQDQPQKNSPAKFKQLDLKIRPNPNLKFETESILAVDLTNNEIIYQKNPDKKQAIASLVKIMTAIVAYEHSVIENIITITDSVKVGESEIGLEEGEKLTVNELIYGLILPSGNDAAEALAVGIAGDRLTFISWMNQKAKDLKMKNSYFANPSGLDQEPPQKSTYSTATDLYILTRYALSFPYLKKVFATDSITFAQNYRRKAYVFNNRLFMHRYYPYIKGIKPGYTDQAGNCLISLAEKDGKEILAIFLNSKDPKEDALALFNYAFKD